MYGDTGVIRRLARSLREQGEAIRAEADRLVGLADTIPWDGWSARAMRLRAQQGAAALRRTAEAHADAAAALERHAVEVDRLTALIAAVERRAAVLVDAARERLTDLAHRLADGVPGLVADPVDELLDRFVPPPPGHRDWLDVELPGLSR